MNNDFYSDLLEVIQIYLKPYLQQFYQVDKVYHDKNEITIRGMVNENDNASTLVLKVIISYENKQVYIPNIFMPSFMRHKGIGKQLISKIYKVSKYNNFDLFIVDLVSSFYERLVKRGAFICEEYEAVQITDTTDLNKREIL